MGVREHGQPWKEAGWFIHREQPNLRATYPSVVSYEMGSLCNEAGRCLYCYLK